jgi:assimilatory nitrate reductase catalytic subunit
VGCGVLVEANAKGGFKVKGDPNHPANAGRLCSKGSALAETLDHPDRLLYPEIAGQRVDWSTATQTIAKRFQQIIQTHGADAVAFYVSGQLLTEDYYVANKLMKGFIGSANIDTNSRLCMSSAVAAHKRAFGEDLVSCSYEDLDEADLIVLVGSNTAWCHPVLYQRIMQAKQNNPTLKIITIDPRCTQTAESADLHLGLASGTDALLFNGLLVYLAANGYQDSTFIEYSTEGFEAALHTANLSSPTIQAVALQCQLTETEVRQFFQLFAHTEKVVTVFSQGINQSSSGVDKGNSIINCHLLTGRLGKSGRGAFSFTGQPNAMGGREVGGLANQLAAHMEIDNPIHRERVQRFWQSPTIATKAGLKAVDLFQAIEQGKVKAVWIMATNPVVSLPDTEQVKRALGQCELVIVSDCVRHTDTTAFADILLPALTWGERNGTVTNTERRISRQHPFLPAPAEAKPDWQIICEVAQALGFAQYFDYPSTAAIFREHAALSAFENQGERCFNLSAWQQLTQQDYDELLPTQWPVTLNAPHGTKRLFTDQTFFTSTGKAQFIAITPRPPRTKPCVTYPSVLNTGRVRDHWHTLTRTGITERLSAHSTEPYVDIHPEDAARYFLANGDLAEVYNELGKLILRIKVNPKQSRGSLFVPMHWNQQFSSAANLSTVIPAETDPISGQPESKHAVVAIRPYPAQWQGVLITREPIAIPSEYWSRYKIKGGWCYTLASSTLADFKTPWFTALKTEQGYMEYCDNTQHHYRLALWQEQRLALCLFISPTTQALPSRQWLTSLLTQETFTTPQRNQVLSGKPFTAQPDQGRIICSCFNVGENTIRQAIQQQGLTSVQAIGTCLKAGTNCGSCVSELNQLLQTERQQ